MFEIIFSLMESTSGLCTLMSLQKDLIFWANPISLQLMERKIHFLTSLGASYALSGPKTICCCLYWTSISTQYFFLGFIRFFSQYILLVLMEGSMSKAMKNAWEVAFIGFLDFERVQYLDLN